MAGNAGELAILRCQYKREERYLGDHGYEPYFVRAVKALEWPYLLVMFMDNTVRKVDISEALDKPYAPYEFLLDPEVFSRVYVNISKISITWNELLDIPGYALRDIIPSEPATWPGPYPKVRLEKHEIFRHWKIWTGQWPGDRD
jgi:hypothetical protein